jgi:hypothetical protein
VKRTLALLVATLALAACMEMEQESAKKEVGKTVKSDTLPWNNEPVAGGPKWTKGDRNSWEDQIKKRQLAQHEHKRIYQ